MFFLPEFTVGRNVSSISGLWKSPSCGSAMDHWGRFQTKQGVSHVSLRLMTSVQCSNWILRLIKGRPLPAWLKANFNWQSLCSVRQKLMINTKGPENDKEESLELTIGDWFGAIAAAMLKECVKCTSG